MPKTSDKDITPETILDELLQFTSMHESGNLTPLNTHSHHDFVPLIDPNTVTSISQYNGYSNGYESNNYHQNSNHFDPNPFYSNSTFSTNSYDNLVPVMAYDPMLYEISNTMTNGQKEYQELEVVSKAEADSNPIYLDFNLNNNVERPVKKRKRNHHQQPVHGDNNQTSGALTNDCKFMEYINEKGVTIRATYLDTTETAGVNAATQKPKLIKREKSTSPSVSINDIEVTEYQDNNNIIMINQPQIDANIVALKTVIDQFNEYKAQHILVCKPKKTKRNNPQTPQQRAQLIEEKLITIDSMPIDIPLISNVVSLTARQGRKQQLKTISYHEDNFSFDTIEVESTGSPSGIVPKNLFGESVKQKHSKNNKLEKNLVKKIFLNESNGMTMDTNESQNYIKPKQKSDSKQQRDESSLLSKRKLSDTMENDESDSDEIPDDTNDTRKTLKCTGCRKIFITRRSLVKHEKRCEDSLGCQPLDAGETAHFQQEQQQRRRSMHDESDQYEQSSVQDESEKNDLIEMPQLTAQFIETKAVLESHNKHCLKANKNKDLQSNESIALSSYGECDDSNPTMMISKRTKSKAKYSIVCDICNKKFTKKGLYVIHKAVDHKDCIGKGCSINLRSKSNRSGSMNEGMPFDDNNAQRRTSLRCSTSTTKI